MSIGKYLFLSLCFYNLCYADMNSPLYTPQMKAMQQKQNKTIQKAIMKQEIQKASANNKQAPSMASSDVMIVDPVKVSTDWKQAFNMLKVRQVQNLTFALADGGSISNIESIDSLPGGYLMIFTIKNLHGIHYKIIKTSEIISLSSK